MVRAYVFPRRASQQDTVNYPARLCGSHGSQIAIFNALSNLEIGGSSVAIANIDVIDHGEIADRAMLKRDSIDGAECWRGADHDERLFYPCGWLSSSNTLDGNETKYEKNGCCCIHGLFVWLTAKDTGPLTGCER
jgi:hypothetical protein